MTTSYCSSLKGSDKDRYERKLRCLFSEAGKEDQPLKSLDPYQLDTEAWIDDPSLWPEVEFPQIYIYGSECQNEWFHYQCVGLDTEPAGDWFCSECRSVS